MFPILISIGPIVLYALSVFIILSWLSFSFLFWRSLRNHGVGEERIFDLTFYSTLIAAFIARVGFIVGNWETFAGKNPLLFGAVWVAPGFSFTAGLIAGVIGLMLLAKLYKIRIGVVLDSLALALPLPLIIGKIGSLLDGSEIGRSAVYPWAIRYLGHPGLRHPVQLYEMLGFIFILSLIMILTQKSLKNKWPLGLVGVWFFLLYCQTQFALEYLKETRVYLVGLSVNQWVYLAIFFLSLGVLFVRGRMQEKFVVWMQKSKQKLSKSEQSKDNQDAQKTAKQDLNTQEL